MLSIAHTISATLLLLPLLSLASLGSTIDREISFACPESSNSQVFKAIERTYSHFFEMNGQEFSMRTTTEKRMLLEISSERLDGGCAQSNPVFDNLNSPILVRGNTPIAQLLVKALSRQELSDLSALEQLQDTAFRVGIVGSSGTALAAKKLNLKFQNILTIDRGVKMLAANRLDYVISNHLQLNRVNRTIDPTHPLHLSKTLFHLDIYPILHKKHRGLIPAIDDYLSQLQQCLGGPLSQVNREAWVKITSSEIDMCLDRPLETQ
ncbi:MAG: hypothetical protein ACRBBW_01015 [Cellvibrionaceae bacterium]